MKKVGGMGSGLSGLSGLSGFSIGGAWTPASPTSDGGYLPHTWFYPTAGLWQESTKVTPAVSEGDPVGAWENQGSFDYDVLQTTSANKFTLRLNAMNGYPVLRGDGGDWLTFIGGLAFDAARVIFAVAKITDTNAEQRLIVNSKDGTQNFCIIRIYTDSNQVGAFENTASAIEGDVSYSSWASQFLAIHRSIEGTGVYSYVNGGTPNFDASATNWAFVDTEVFNISKRRNNSNNIITGDVAEILIYANNLSASDINEISTYLDNKYSFGFTPVS